MNILLLIAAVVLAWLAFKVVKGVIKGVFTIAAVGIIAYFIYGFLA